MSATLSPLCFRYSHCILMIWDLHLWRKKRSWLLMAEGNITVEVLSYFAIKEETLLLCWSIACTLRYSLFLHRLDCAALAIRCIQNSVPISHRFPRSSKEGSSKVDTLCHWKLFWVVEECSLESYYFSDACVKTTPGTCKTERKIH